MFGMTDGGVTGERRGDGGDCQSPLQERGALAPPLLSAEGWVAFGAAGLFVAGEVAYL